MLELNDPMAIRVADVLRYSCLVVGVCFAAAVARLVRHPSVRDHVGFRAFRARLFAIALGVTLTVVLQYERLHEPVHLVTLPLSVVLLAVSMYAVWMPVTDLRNDIGQRLRDL